LGTTKPKIYTDLNLNLAFGHQAYQAAEDGVVV